MRGIVSVYFQGARLYIFSRSSRFVVMFLLVSTIYRRLRAIVGQGYGRLQVLLLCFRFFCRFASIRGPGFSFDFVVRRQGRLLFNDGRYRRNGP